MVARTGVVVVGAGLGLANVLRDRGIDCVVLEEQTRAFIEARPRAGFIAEWAVRALDERCLADKLLSTAPSQGRFEFRFENGRHPFSYEQWAGQRGTSSIRSSSSSPTWSRTTPTRAATPSSGSGTWPCTTSNRPGESAHLVAPIAARRGRARRRGDRERPAHRRGGALGVRNPAAALAVRALAHRDAGRPARCAGRGVGHDRQRGRRAGGACP